MKEINRIDLTIGFLVGVIIFGGLTFVGILNDEIYSRARVIRKEDFQLLYFGSISIMSCISAILFFLAIGVNVSERIFKLISNLLKRYEKNK